MSGTLRPRNEKHRVLEKLHNWVHCVVVVTFDLELGQAIEHVYPPDCALSEEDKTNVCYLAFPDSNSSCLGDTQFHIRLKQSATSALSACHCVYNNTCPVFLQINPSYLFGFVYFRQVKDPTIPRGYFQKSVILLTRLPFISLFSDVCRAIAPQYFSDGLKSIEAACHEISRWPEPIPGALLKLPLFGNLIQVQVGEKNSGLCFIPDEVAATTTAATAHCYSSSAISLSSLYDINMYEPFVSIIQHIHVLWELVITAEPLIVLAPSPETCSNLVQALISMIVPLKYNADYRPYFTIHDSEFKEYMMKTQRPASVILGVTNPYFGKTLQHWPHIIRVTDAGAGSINSNGGVTAAHKQKLKRNSSLSFFDVKAGVYTRYKSFLHKDKSVIKKLMKGGGMQPKKSSEVQSAILKRYLLELTQSFMIPLERYIATLMPLKKTISPFKSVPLPLPFKQDDFLSSLETAGPELTSTVRGNWTGLYKKFFRCPNFSAWYSTRYKAMTKELKILQLEALSHMNIQECLQGKEEVEKIDMILKIRSKLEEIKNDDLQLKDIIHIQLKNKLNDIVRTLPDDLRNVVHIT